LVRQGTVLAVIGIVLAGAGMAMVLLRERTAPEEAPPADGLVEIVESPRPPVAEERAAPLLRGRPPEKAAEPKKEDRASLLAARNEAAREHRKKVEAYEQGLVSIQEVEEAELRLLEARHRLGEIDDPTWHRGREVLFERAADRTHLAVEAGIASAIEEMEARLSLERERLLAGEANAYAEQRAAFFETLKQRQSALLEAGRATKVSLDDELAKWEAEFPP
jgi:hypothetical protein